MKMVRHVFSNQEMVHTGPPLVFVDMLLQAGADPFVCCDVGKNVLHDLVGYRAPELSVSLYLQVWAAVPSSDFRTDTSDAMESIISFILREIGRDTTLQLLLSQDKNGNTPCEYLKSHSHPNWQQFIDLIIGHSESPGSSSKRSTESSSDESTTSCKRQKITTIPSPIQPPMQAVI